MASAKKDPVLVVLQLTGGNDYFNTVIPINDPRYRDNRPAVGIAEDQVIPLDDQFGFHPNMAPLKEIWDDGKLALIHGVGYENSPAFSLPVDGYLAHLRAGQGGDRRLAGTGHT